MKALRLHGIGDLRYEDVPDPKPAKGQVLLKIKACGICGSDIPRVLIKGTYHFPTIPGHEFSGQIVETGEGVDKALIGKKAAVFPLLPCGECGPCKIGGYEMCEHYNYFGSRCDGGFAEYIAVPVWNLVMVPESVDYEVAAMCEPCSVAVHALRNGGIEIGDNVAIFGSGPIGMMLAQWSMAWGADKVFLIDNDDRKVAFAKKIGFENVFNTKDGSPSDWIKDNTNGKGADLCIEGAGVSPTLEAAAFSARPLGRLVCMGNPAGDMKLSQNGYWQIMRKQLRLFGTWNSGYAPLPKNDWQLSIRSMETGKLNLKQLITHRVGLSDGIKPFKMMKERSEFFEKVMFLIDK